ncbi:hypothetical protein DD237_001114 [Peronospora effusa]|uniref:Uncharacterized protein n=1 Tax=Peronospora effusa TaxID=542832 RepID=A0A425CJY9_9STRA|nr:hypothetical protein DD237_001114 [Peronospora effusa]
MKRLRGEESKIIEVSVTQAITETPVLTQTEMSQLRILKKNPPPILAEPQLMGLLQRERSHLLGLIAPQPLVKLIQPFHTAFRAVDDTAGQLQLRAVTTPATGNCMAMAIVQALCYTDLAAQDTQLAAATGSLKRGIKHAGQLHLGKQFPHDTRIATLIALQRGRTDMEKKQFKWYLEDYGKSPSERNAKVHVHNWGGCETLYMATYFFAEMFTSLPRVGKVVMTSNAACTGRVP